MSRSVSPQDDNANNRSQCTMFELRGKCLRYALIFALYMSDCLPHLVFPHKFGVCAT